MITNLKIENFRSLRSVELSPGPLTVLIGANGSGKSNIIDALRFVDSFAWQGGNSSDEAEQRGGWKELVWGGQTDSELKIDVSWEQGADRRVNHSITFGCRDDRSVRVFRESANVNDDPPLVRRESENLYAGVSIQSGQPVYHSESAVFQYVRDRSHDSPDLCLPDCAFYNLSPGAARGAKPVRREYRLDADGGNLATVVHTLFSDGDPSLDEAVGMLQTCVPTIEALVSPIIGEGQTYVALRERGIPTPIGSWGLSDGTLLALSIAVALITPKMPDLICIESPEDGIHPQMLETIADMLEVASSHTQVIVTTHSPHLLYWLSPKTFVVVEKDDGETRLHPLKDDTELQKVARDLGAGDAWYSGYLGGIP